MDAEKKEQEEYNNSDAAAQAREQAILSRLDGLIKNFVRHNPSGKEENPQLLYEAFARFFNAVEQHEVSKGR